MHLRDEFTHIEHEIDVLGMVIGSANGTNVNALTSEGGKSQRTSNCMISRCTLRIGLMENFRKEGIYLCRFSSNETLVDG